MRIANFGQMLDVRTRSFQHQMLVITDDGRQHVIATDEDTVQQLIQAMTNSGHTMPASEPPEISVNREAFLREEPSYHLPQEPEGEDELVADIFGGDVDPGEQAPEPVMGVIAEDRIADVPAEPRGLGSRQPPKAAPPPTRPPRVDADGFALPVPARTVPKDEMGYPIVAKNRNAPVLPDDGGDDGNQI